MGESWREISRGTSETIEQMAARHQAEARRSIALYQAPAAILLLGGAAYKWIAQRDGMGGLVFFVLALFFAELVWKNLRYMRRSEERLRKLIELREHPTDHALLHDLVSWPDPKPRWKRIRRLVWGLSIGFVLIAAGGVAYVLTRESSGAALSVGYGALLTLAGACFVWVSIWAFIGRPRVADMGMLAGIAIVLLGMVYLVIASLVQGAVYAALLCAAPIAIMAILGGIQLMNADKPHPQPETPAKASPMAPSRERLAEMRAENRRMVRRAAIGNSLFGPFFILISLVEILHKRNYVLGAMQLLLGMQWTRGAVAEKEYLRDTEDTDKALDMLGR